MQISLLIMFTFVNCNIWLNSIFRCQQSLLYMKHIIIVLLVIYVYCNAYCIH